MYIYICIYIYVFIYIYLWFYRLFLDTTEYSFASCFQDTEALDSLGFQRATKIQAVSMSRFHLLYGGYYKTHRIHGAGIYANIWGILIWVNYNDLTATEPWKSLLIGGIIPKWP